LSQKQKLHGKATMQLTAQKSGRKQSKKHQQAKNNIIKFKYLPKGKAAIKLIYNLMTLQPKLF
jgi:hypothetical protein